MMRRASIAAVAWHDAFGCVLTRWLGSSRADKYRENRTGHPVSRVTRSKHVGGGGPAADL
eukprot:1616892-Prymnesium_polylepis.1